MSRSACVLVSLFVFGAVLLSSCSDQSADKEPDHPKALAEPSADSIQSSGLDKAASRAVILVTGATGNQGGAVARELLARGYLVRGLTRNPDSDRARALAALGANMVRGDFADPESLSAAMQGTYGVFAMTDFWEHGFDLEVVHGQRLVDAARKAGVQHFVYTSVAGAHQNTGIPHFDSKFVVEQYLVASGMPHSIVRPVSFLDNWQYAHEELMGGSYADPRESGSRHQWIAARDIGFIVGEAFDHPDFWLGRAEDIAGVEMTLGDFLGVVSASLGRPVAHDQVSWEAYEADAGAEMTHMTRWFQDVGYSADVADLRSRYPGLTEADDYLRALGWSSSAGD